MTAKQQRTEKWVDAYILMNNRPPTYKEIQEAFNLGKCAAYSRCSKFRHKMSQHTKLIKSDAVEFLNWWFASDYRLSPHYQESMFLHKGFLKIDRLITKEDHITDIQLYELFLTHKKFLNERKHETNRI